MRWILKHAVLNVTYFQAKSRSQMIMSICIMINLKIQQLFFLVAEPLKALKTVIAVATKFAFMFGGK